MILKEVQQLLEPDTLLLEYALGEERSYLWAVTPTTLNSFELPRRADITTAAKRVYELLKAQSPDKGRDLGGKASAHRTGKCGILESVASIERDNLKACERALGEQTSGHC